MLQNQDLFRGKFSPALSKSNSFIKGFKDMEMLNEQYAAEYEYQVFELK